MLLLGFIQATKGSSRTHTIILTNGRKKRSGSVGRVLYLVSKDDLFVTHHESKCCVIGLDAFISCLVMVEDSNSYRNDLNC